MMTGPVSQSALEGAAFGAPTPDPCSRTQAPHPGTWEGLIFAAAAVSWALSHRNLQGRKLERPVSRP